MEESSGNRDKLKGAEGLGDPRPVSNVWSTDDTDLGMD